MTWSMRERCGKHEFRGRIPCRTDISERPAVVEERSRPLPDALNGLEVSATAIGPDLQPP